MQRLLQVYGSGDRGSLYSLIVNQDSYKGQLDATEQAALQSIYQKYFLETILSQLKITSSSAGWI